MQWFIISVSLALLFECDINFKNISATMDG